MFPEEFLPVEIKLELGFSGRWFNNCKQLPSGSLNKIIFLGVLGKILVDIPQNLVLFHTLLGNRKEGSLVERKSMVLGVVNTWFQPVHL